MERCADCARCQSLQSKWSNPVEGRKYYLVVVLSWRGRSDVVSLGVQLSRFMVNGRSWCKECLRSFVRGCAVRDTPALSPLMEATFINKTRT